MLTILASIGSVLIFWCFYTKKTKNMAWIVAIIFFSQILPILLHNKCVSIDNIYLEQKHLYDEEYYTKMYEIFLTKEDVQKYPAIFNHKAIQSRILKERIEAGIVTFNNLKPIPNMRDFSIFEQVMITLCFISVVSIIAFVLFYNDLKEKSVMNVIRKRLYTIGISSCIYGLSLFVGINIPFLFYPKEKHPDEKKTPCLA